MTYKPAKERFTRQEVVDILKRNVALYRDEDGFVDYLVELTLYLLSNRTSETQQHRAAEPTLPESYQARQSAPKPTRERPESIVMPPTVNELRDRQADPESGRYKPVPYQRTSAPPPPATPPSTSPAPGRNPAPPPAHPLPQPQRASSASGVFQIRSFEEPLTPPPPHATPPQVPPPHPKPDEEMDSVSDAAPPHERANPQQGPPPPGPPPPSKMLRTMRLRPISSVREVSCNICGTRVAVGIRQCPGCGHIMPTG